MASNSKVSVRKSAVTNTVDDVVFRGISSVVERQSVGTWVGTITNLTTALNRVLSKKQRVILPGSPGALRVVINRVVNRLRNRGIGVKFGRTSDHMRTRFVKFAR
jgi:hypothetical protein